MKTNNLLSSSEARRLLLRYYDALTTDEEERALRRFLASSRADGEEFQSHRAVFGFLAVGRKIRRTRKPLPQRRRRQWMAAAAVVLLSLGSGLVWWHAAQSANSCVAYIGGRRYTDKKMVMEQMQKTMLQLRPDPSVPTVRNQMHEVLDLE